MKPFCEVVVQTIVPGIRALLAKDMMEKHGMTQQETASRLGITQAAVSQYRRSLRGYNIRLLEENEHVMKEIRKLSSKLSKAPISSVEAHLNFCEVCKIARTKEVLCALHREKYPGLENCNICLGEKKE